MYYFFLHFLRFFVEGGRSAKFFFFFKCVSFLQIFKAFILLKDVKRNSFFFSEFLVRLRLTLPVRNNKKKVSLGTFQS